MFIVLAGEGTYRFGPDSYPIKAGDVLGAPRAARTRRTRSSTPAPRRSATTAYRPCRSPTCASTRIRASSASSAGTPATLRPIHDPTPRPGRYRPRLLGRRARAAMQRMPCGSSAMLGSSGIGITLQRSAARQVGVPVPQPPRRGRDVHHPRGRGDLPLRRRALSDQGRRCARRAAGGHETAHQIINTGTKPLRYYGISTMSLADVCEYPDSGKFGVFSRSTRNPYDKSTVRHLARAGTALDYWDGEPGAESKDQ